MSTRIRAAGILAAGALALTACGSPFTHTVTGAAASASSSSPAATSSAAAPSSDDSGQTPMDSGDPTTTAPALPSDQAGRNAADLAQAVMTAYQVTGPIDPDSWYNRIAPYLLSDVRRDYSYTDPANIRVHQLLGLATVVRQTQFLAVVTQNTNDGVYTITEAADIDGQLKVARIDPPEGSGS